MTETITVVEDVPAADAPVLVVVGAGGIARHPLPRRGRVVVGRAPDCDVVIAEASVSRRHAAFDLGDTLAVEDLGSANGCAIRGVRVAGRTALGWGESVRIGSATLLVVRDRHRGAAPGPQLAGPVIVDPRMRTIVQVIDRVAAGELGVLLTGETGSGKEVLAELVHARSPRAAGPFVAINCAALPDGLVEAELFGHERGAYTGATASRRGLFEEADGGTLFLDEVGELTPGAQAKLLRVLEERTVRPVGARAAVGVDVRVVAATHRDLRDDAAGFRRDLFYRLAGIVIAVPPLRDRRDDILPLADHFLARAAAAAGHAPPTLGPAARDWLLAQPWPGNVRELRNAIERAVLLCDGGVVEVPHLAGEPVDATPAGSTLKNTLAGVERARIRAVLDDCRWNQSEAARRLGMARNTLAAKIRAYELRR
jgi:DNA-binding NtrC family response regulator